MEKIHSSTADASGLKKSHVVADYGLIDTEIVIPEGLDTQNKRVTPETLFSAAFAACLLSAIRTAAKLHRIELTEDIRVHSDVQLLTHSGENYKLEVVLKPQLHLKNEQQKQQLMTEAIRMFPFDIHQNGSHNLSVRVEME